MKLYWGKHKCAIGIHMLPKRDRQALRDRGPRGSTWAAATLTSPDSLWSTRRVALPVNVKAHDQRMLPRRGTQHRRDVPVTRFPLFNRSTP
jgi:hypothetical protein